MSENTGDVLTTGAIIARMVANRDERRRISDRDKELVEEWRGLETEFIGRLDEQGQLKATTVDGTASITEQTLPQVTDWDALYAFILENEAFYLLQRRPAAAAFREHNQAGDEIPGIEPFIKRTISLRKA